MKIGYARVSTGEQKMDLQLDALEEAGCERVYQEEISGAAASRPDLECCMGELREGDTLVVWRLDRFGWSLKVEPEGSRPENGCSRRERSGLRLA